MRGKHMHHMHRRGGVEIPTGDPERWALPLGEHPQLEVETDFVNLVIAPVVRGESPRLELYGAAPLPHVDVRGDGGVTKVTIGGWLGGPRDEWPGDRPRGRHGFWDGPFWNKQHWKRKFHTKLIAYVPPNVRARVRSGGAQLHATGLVGCDLRIELDAGALSFTDVSGRLSLTTEAGRIDGHGVGGTIDVSTSAGAVQLDVTHLDPGTHRIRTNMGAAHISLARGIPVQIETQTTLGSTRVDFPSTEGAASILYVGADLGAIKIGASGRTWVPSPAPMPRESAPYRASAKDEERPIAGAVGGDMEIERILERVASGSLSPAQAREMLSALGWA